MGISKEKMASKTFTEFMVWQKAHQFVLSVYAYTQTFPKQEQFALTSQFKRAAISIAANIAEGYRKMGKADKARFFNIAQGSIAECEYYLILSKDLHYGANEKLQLNLHEVSRMLESYRSKLLTSIS